MSTSFFKGYRIYKPNEYTNAMNIEYTKPNDKECGNRKLGVFWSIVVYRSQLLGIIYSD